MTALLGVRAWASPSIPHQTLTWAIEFSIFSDDRSSWCQRRVSGWTFLWRATVSRRACCWLGDCKKSLWKGNQGKRDERQDSEQTGFLIRYSLYFMFPLPTHRAIFMIAKKKHGHKWPWKGLSIFKKVKTRFGWDSTHTRKKNMWRKKDKKEELGYAISKLNICT